MVDLISDEHMKMALGDPKGFLQKAAAQEIPVTFSQAARIVQVIHGVKTYTDNKPPTKEIKKAGPMVGIAVGGQPERRVRGWGAGVIETNTTAQPESGHKSWESTTLDDRKPEENKG